MVKLRLRVRVRVRVWVRRLMTAEKDALVLLREMVPFSAIS